VPPSSADLVLLEGKYRLDPWGHPFCVAVNSERVIVMSWGPRRPEFAECTETGLDPISVKALSLGVLHRFKSGVLVLVVSGPSSGG
jgi:hypothetical protein